MNKPAKEPQGPAIEKTGLELLREPFPQSHISKLPKPTRHQTDEVKADFKKGVRCEVCGGWHHPRVIHLDYVGHAALTDRLLDCDPTWNWEPVAVNEDGTPSFDAFGGMWIKLTVCDVTRLGYGHPDGKKGGDAIKELIGDALRNAAMRFGAALDLWHKGDLHGMDEGEPPIAVTVSPGQYVSLRDKAHEANVPEETICKAAGCTDLQQFPSDKLESAMKKLDLALDMQKKNRDLLDGDKIPY